MNKVNAFNFSKGSEDEVSDHGEDVLGEERTFKKYRVSFHPLTFLDFQFCEKITKPGFSGMNFDRDGYPLRPNGDLSWGFCDSTSMPNLVSHYTEWSMKVQYQDSYSASGLTIKVLLKVCLGIYRCEGFPECKATKRPVQRNTAEKVKTLRCKICNSRFGWITCHCSLRFDELDRKIIVRHNGFHDYECPEVVKADFYCKQSFSEMVKKNPKKTPLNLLVGENNTGNIPTRNIHSAFNNRDRVAYLRQVQLKELGLNYDYGSTYDSYLDFQKTFGEFISTSYKLSSMHLSYMNDFMKKVLLDSCENTGRSIPGIITDVTHKYFKDGFCLTSCVYSIALNRWIPVLISWLHGQSDKHMTPHFEVICSTIIENVLDQTAQDTLIASVMDFSKAQRRAFIEAYIRAKKKHTTNYVEYELEEKANALVRGCEEHFRASITRIKRQHAVVPVHEKETFNKLAISLIYVNEEQEFNTIVAEILQRYPHCSNWLYWWLSDSVRTMIFPVYMKMSIYLKNQLPKTTNAIESMHSVFYQIADVNNSVTQGLSYLVLFIKTLESQLEDVLHGRKIQYGEEERWKKIAKKYGSSKLSRLKKHPPNDTSDYRPPDTSEQLFNTGEKRPGRPKNSCNLKRDPQVTYQSYTHKNNTCYITSLLEALYGAFNFLQNNNSEFLNHGMKACKGTIQEKLFSHFNFRIERKNGKGLKSCLTAGLSLFIKWVVEEKRLFSTGSYGNPVDVLRPLILEGCEYFRSLFIVAKKKTNWCEHGCQYESDKEYPLLLLKTEMLKSSFNKNENVKVIVDILCNDGLIYETTKVCRTLGCKSFKVMQKETILGTAKIIFIEINTENNGSCSDCDLFNFPRQLVIRDKNYLMISRIYVSDCQGEHFSTKVFQTYPQQGVYDYNDLINAGIACLSSNETGFSGKHKLGPYIIYVQK
jgi:hypothetical protein